MLRRYILLFAVAKCPNFIALDALARQVAHGLVLILATGRANVYKQLCYGVYRAIGNAGSGAHGVAFNQQVNDLCAFFNWQDVHGNPLSIVQVELYMHLT